MPSANAILFDLDCTLTDRTASLTEYAVHFLQHFETQLEPTDEAAILARISEVDQHGYLPRAKCWAHLLARLGWRQPVSCTEMDLLWESCWPECTKGAPGAEEILRLLRDRGYKLGIITNGPAHTQQRKIDTLKFGKLVGASFVSGEVGIAKPEKAIFHLACSQLGVRPNEAWFVGDNPINDAIGARNAGLVDVWLRGYADWPASRPPATHAIDHLQELLPLLGDS